jgi:EAL domain-containing protein (putative c-di-GMP-specific phosphodiesterase class I)
MESGSLDYSIGIWVMTCALKQLTKWNQQGHSMKVSINIGAHQLLHPEFLNDLKAALAYHPELSADCLEIEVLESVAISDIERTVRVLNECHRFGVKVALDDFGTGYSSLTYLRKLPVDVLKIDQSFVREMLTNQEDHGIVEAVIHLANSFNKQVIAEGVETDAHGAALLQLGCKLVQGNGIAKPMPEHEVQDWIQKWTAQRVWETVK